MRRLAIVSVALWLAGCSRPGAGRIDPALASLVPSDAVLVAGANLEKLRAAPAWRGVGAFEDRLERTGLDARKIYQVLLVSDGARTALLARGEFAPPDGSEPRLNLPGATRTAYEGYTLIASGGQTLAFMNPSTAVMGPADAVRAIIDRRGQSNGLPAALARQLDEVPAAYQIWVIGTAAPSLPLSPNLRRVFAMTESFVAGAEAGENVHGFATLTCRSEQDAADLSGALKALAAFARIGGVEVEQRQRAVRITARLTAAELDALAGN